MGREAGDLVSQPLRGNNSLSLRSDKPSQRRQIGTHDFIDDSLVGVEVEGEAGVAADNGP